MRPTPVIRIQPGDAGCNKNIARSRCCAAVLRIGKRAQVRCAGLSYLTARKRLANSKLCLRHSFRRKSTSTDREIREAQAKLRVRKLAGCRRLRF
jgi:hypothetical protein